MQAATLTPPSGLGPHHTPDETAINRLAIFDDPDEWSQFSRPAGPSTASSGEVSDLWESQVVVRGMYCAACSLALEQKLLAVKGVVSARVSAASGHASIIWSAVHTRPSHWMAAPLALGYQLLPASDAFAFTSALGNTRQQARLMLWRWLVAGFCMMQVMMYAAPGYFSQPGDISPDIEKLLRWASWLLSLPVVLFSCSPFFANALRDLKQRHISMDLPVALGMAVSFAVSMAATFEPQGWWGHEVYFDSFTMFVFFLLTGRWLEQRLRARTAGSLDQLMQRLPGGVERQTAAGLFERVAVRRLRLGDVVRVLPGEAFVADGTLVAGGTLADEALLTGESRPVARAVGESVMAGSYNLTNAVQVRIDALGSATRYGQIVALMAQAASDKPQLVLLADKIAKPFLAAVLLAAVVAAAFWWNTDPARALMTAVAVLVVTCPCALSLATPTALLTSAGLLARHGVLVRRLQAMESLTQIDTVVFDKTGTLTQATLHLRAVHLRDGITQAQALHMAASLAQHSLHPVSRALVAAARKEAQEDSPTNHMALQDVKEVAGQGLEGRLLDAQALEGAGVLRLGSARFCGVEDVPGDNPQVYLADDNGWMARIELEETLRVDAGQAVAALQNAGLDVQLWSGDRQVAAQQVADRLGIRTVRGDCKPQDKLAFMQALQQQGRTVLMVGDGLNDGPVLAGSQVSMVVGTAAPLAQARADFVLPGGQLMVLPGLLVQANRTLHIVRQNLGWAALYNATCVPLALAGLLPAWLAGLGMACSSLLVVANAARLSRWKATP